ncbi:nuclear transport factor 2 family protein [Lysobacter claricitrinus]|uniref:nuclear transport factor 2 family protein n=1 Tax=Lysobacter claricitrinus TaxID=3367728 RepID=UPI0037DA9E9C
MRIALLSLALLASTPAFAMDRAERELRDTEAALCHAFEIGDVDYLRRALDPGFTLTGSSGVVENLQQTLDEVTKREPRYDEFRNSDQVVRRYGDAAVVTGITHIRGTAGGQAFAADSAFTDTWIRRANGWVLVASHAWKRPAPTH